MAKYNKKQYNLSLYNGNFISGLPPTTTDKIGYNGFSLQNDNVITSDLNIENITRDFQAGAAPQGDGMILNSDNWRNKRITLRGNLVSGSNASLNSLIFNIKKQLNVTEKALDVIQGDGSKRRFICTATTIDIPRDKHFHISFTPFRIVFDCLIPFGQALGYSSRGETVTDLIFKGVAETEGNAIAEAIWVIIITEDDAVTGINIKNDTTGDEVEITNALVTGDVLIINGETKTVELNGVNIDFNGSLPRLQPTSNQYTITVAGTSIKYELTEKNLAKFL